VTPIASGRPAEASDPKMITSRTARIGIEIVSARAMSALTRSLMSRLIVVPPPIWVSRPGAASSSSISSRPSVRWSSSPARVSTA